MADYVNGSSHTEVLGLAGNQLQELGQEGDQEKRKGPKTHIPQTVGPSSPSPTPMPPGEPPGFVNSTFNPYLLVPTDPHQCMSSIL